MGRKPGPGNLGINDMSFKDLSAKAAVAVPPKPAETKKTPAAEKGPKVDCKAPVPGTKAS